MAYFNTAVIQNAGDTDEVHYNVRDIIDNEWRLQLASDTVTATDP